jgi:AraC family transcriptional regulator
LARLHAGDGRPPAIERGGLAGWQQRIVCDFINDNLDRDISLEELAALAKLSPTHFCRSFTRSLGMPPHQYQVRQRVEHAKQLLAEPDRTITEVAIAAGYSVSSNFATVFRRVTGVSPREFRRSLQ